MAGTSGLSGATPDGMSTLDSKIFDDLVEECGGTCDLWHVSGDPKPWKGKNRRKRTETEQPTIESLATWARAQNVRAARAQDEVER